MISKALSDGAAPDIDPELARQLDASVVADKPIEAVIRLRPDTPEAVVPSPERTEAMIHDLLARVRNHSAPEPRYNVFRNLGSFVVCGAPSLIRELIAQPEVRAAVANRQGTSSSPPVEKTRGRAPRRLARKRHK